MTQQEQSLHYYIAQISEQEIQRSLRIVCQKPICACKYCSSNQELQCPPIKLNKEFTEITSRSQNSRHSQSDQWVEFLELLARCNTKMPNLPLMDTIVFRNGHPSYIIKYQRAQKIVKEECPDYQSAILDRKREVDIHIMKQLYLQKHPQFVFSSLDHLGQMTIRSFVSKVEQTPSELRRVASMKLLESEAFLVTHRQLITNVNSKTDTYFPTKNLEYIQVFPIPPEHQQFFRSIPVPFLREHETSKQEFVEAQFYYPMWLKQSKVLMEQEEAFIQSLGSIDSYLVYFTYKLVIHIQHAGQYRIDSMIADFYVDKFGGFSLRRVRNLCYTDLRGFNHTDNTIRKAMEIPRNNYIILQDKMQEYFSNWRTKLEQFKEVERGRQEVNERDRQYSQQVHRGIRGEGKTLAQMLSAYKP